MSLSSVPPQWARIVSPVTGEEINVPYQGDFETAKAFFEPLGIKVVSWSWMKTNWEREYARRQSKTQGSNPSEVREASST